MALELLQDSRIFCKRSATDREGRFRQNALPVERLAELAGRIREHLGPREG